MSSRKSQKEQLSLLFRSIASGDYEGVVDTDNEHSLLQQAGIDFLDALGYSGKNVYLDLRFERHPRVSTELTRDEIYADVVAAGDITAPPFLVIKTFFNPQPDVEVIYETALSTGAKYTIGFSEKYLVISQPPADPRAPGEVLQISEIISENINRLYDRLSPPTKFPSGDFPRFPPGHHPDQTKLTRWLFADSDITPEYRSNIHTEHFELDIDKYADLLFKAYSVSRANEKGDALEDVAAFLFEGMKDVTLRDRNVRTQSREIDLVLEHTESRKSLFKYYSRFILVECKNRDQSMRVGDVDKFINNLRDTGSELGIIISWNGISGEDSGDDATRVIDSTDNEMEIIALSSRELYRILDGESLYEIIDDRLFAQQFDL